MSNFLEGFKVVHVSLDVSPDPTATPTQSLAGQEIQPSTPKSPKNHHSSSDGAEFMAIPITAIVFTFIYLIVKAIMAPFTQRARQNRRTPDWNGGGLTAEEVAILQKLTHTLAQMERRVETLETILIEPAHKKETYGSKL